VKSKSSRSLLNRSVSLHRKYLTENIALTLGWVTGRASGT